MNGQMSLHACSVAVDDMTREEWKQILRDFDDASIYQTWEYGEVRWGQKNLSRIVLKDKDGSVVSAAQVRIVRVPLVGVGLAYVFYGPMWKARDKERNLVNFRAGLCALVNEYVRSRGLFLRLRPYGFEEIDYDMKCALGDAGFNITRGLYRDKHQTMLMDLAPSGEDLRQGLRKSWRKSLRQAEKANLEIVEAFDATSFDQFKPVFLDMLAEKKFDPGSDVNEFYHIQQRLAPEQKMRVTFCKMGGEVVCGAVSSSIGDTVIGLLAATGQAGRKLQASYLLQWDEVLWSKQAGKRHLDLGGSNSVTNPGGYIFKTGVRPREVTSLGVYDICESKGLYHATLGLESVLRWRNRLLLERKLV